MTINEAIGVNLFGMDIRKGELVSCEEEIQRKIAYLGGTEAIAPYIPFPLPFLAEKLKTDPYLNNTSLREWDLAAGFKSISFCTTPLLVRGGIWELYRKKGICAASCAEGVSILKTAAQILIEAEK